MRNIRVIQEKEITSKEVLEEYARTLQEKMEAEWEWIKEMPYQEKAVKLMIEFKRTWGKNKVLAKATWNKQARKHKIQKLNVTINAKEAILGKEGSN